MSHESKRQGLRSAAAAVPAAMTLGKPYSAGAAASPGPNETIHVGLIGCGGEGRAVLEGHLLCSGTRAAAVCDVHEERLAAGVKAARNDAVLAFHDFRELLDRRDIDTVIVATNGHWHVLPTIEACKAGKDVYVEKPLGTSIGEGRAAVEAARKYDRIVQIGTQQRSWPHYQQAAKAIQSGRLGEISEVKVWDYDYFYPGFGAPPDGDPPAGFDWDFWLGPSPKAPYNPNRFIRHYWYFDYAGGWQLDWAVHHYDIVHWCMQVTAPEAATASGGFFCFDKTNTEWPDTFSGICHYGPGPVAKKGFLLQYTFRGGCRREQVSHAKCFFGSEASMLISRSGYTIRSEKGKRDDVETVDNAFKSGNVHVESLRAHAQVFLDGVRSRQRTAADVEQGHTSSNPGHLMNIAWRVGRPIRWDAKNERVLDDPEADALVTKKYREPWKLMV